MNATIPVPAWLVLLFCLLGGAWTIADVMRARAWRDLMNLYWHNVHGCEVHEEPGSPTPSSGATRR